MVRWSIGSFSVSFLNISLVSWGLLVAAFLDSGNNLVFISNRFQGAIGSIQGLWLGTKMNPSPELTRILFRRGITAGLFWVSRYYYCLAFFALWSRLVSMVWR